jgi:hypothetical protein
MKSKKCRSQHLRRRWLAVTCVSLPLMEVQAKSGVPSLSDGCKMLLLLQSNYEITPWNAETLSYRKLHLTHYIKLKHMIAFVRENAFLNVSICMQFFSLAVNFSSTIDRKLRHFYTNQFVTIFGRKWNRQEKCLGMTHETKNQQNVVELFCRSEYLTTFRYYQVGNNLRKW